MPSLLLQGETRTRWGIVKGNLLRLPSDKKYNCPSLGSGIKVKPRCKFTGDSSKGPNK